MAAALALVAAVFAGAGDAASVLAPAAGAAGALRRGAEVPAKAPLCAVITVRSKKDPTSTVALRLRTGSVKVVDFFQFFNHHELPELRVRLAETADYVDEIHIAEGTRDFSGAPKALLWPSLANGSDALLAKYLHKITYHPVEVPLNATSYDIQRSALDAQLKVPGRGVMLEGDLDEVVRREVLQAVRACEPADGSGWNANVQMKDFTYSLAWGGVADWENPPLVREFDHTGSAPGTSVAQVAARPHGVRQVGVTRYIRNVENHIVMTDGRTAGWHISWALDGPEGIAEKVLHGHIEGIYKAFAPYAGNRSSLVEFLRDKYLPNLQAYQPGLARSKGDDLPQAIRDDPDLFRPLLGDLKTA